MVKEVENKNKKYYQCENCKFHFEDKNIAQKCEDFCNKNNSCNVDIIKYAVKLDK